MTETKIGSTDQQLVTRVQQGDKRAFDLLVLKYQYRVHAIVGRFIRDSHEVEDITQEAFLKAYRALPRFRGDSQFYTWLFRIAVNTAKNYLVARSRRPPSSDVNLDDAEFYAGSEQLKDLGTPENQLFRDELEMVINKAIEELPEDLRTAVTLREYEGLSYEDIAGVMDCPVGTVRSRIFRGRESIDISVLELMEGS
jgi:RNA polymerase sigma-70 factor (ECF subfamily)